MRNIFVPQTGHVPWAAGFPFFIVMCFASFISRFALHLTQYASATPGASLSSTVDVVGPLARRSSVTSDTGSAQPSGADSSNPTDPGRRELAQR